MGDAGASVLITYTFGSAIPIGGTNPVQVVVSYFKFTLAEQLTFVSQELDTLTSNTPVPLQQTGFVYNTWLPVSYSLAYNVPNNGIPVWGGGTASNLALVTDAGLAAALVPYTSRYIKVTWNNGVSDIVQRENIDYTLVVNANTGGVTLARILGGGIPDGGTVKVSYFINETFTVATEYPAFVEILANTISQSQAAGVPSSSRRRWRTPLT